MDIDDRVINFIGSKTAMELHLTKYPIGQNGKNNL